MRITVLIRFEYLLVSRNLTCIYVGYSAKVKKSDGKNETYDGKNETDDAKNLTDTLRIPSLLFV